jgi:MFS transporter, ACS family, hexuronate transporter
MDQWLEQVNRRRWWIVALLFIASVLNYIDRQSLSILALPIQHSFGFGDVTYSHILTAFLVAYTIAYVLAGRFSDMVGASRSMMVFIAIWSTAELLPPFLHNTNQLGLSRFVLGLGEAGIWVVAPKIVCELFPPNQRAFAIGIYTAGATIGATIAPPFLTLLVNRHGWASAFFVTGIAGLMWLLPWKLMNLRLSASTQPDTQKTTGSSEWIALLKKRNLWMLLIARLLTDPVWYFYLFWYPKYLGQARHQSFTAVGHSVWIVYFFADIGTIAGGWFSGVLIRKGMKPVFARKFWMSCIACVLPLSPLAALLPSGKVALGIAAVIALAHMAWLVTLTALILDIFPASQVGSAAGWIAAGSGLGGILFTEIVGRCVSTVGYLPVFYGMGLLHPIALIFIWRVRPQSSELFPQTHEAYEAVG